MCSHSTMNESPPSFFPLSEEGILIRLGLEPSLEVHHRVRCWTRHLEKARPGWAREWVPAITELVLLFHADRIGWNEVVDWLKEQRPDEAPESQTSGREVVIPVRYGGTDGPDLGEVARHASLSEKEVIRRHLAGPYRVAMLGFTPGFPYLVGLDPMLACPRRESPRLRVPRGSVGIAGAQTGIYSCEGPGGWQIIGRTASSLFDPEAEKPFLLRPGDRVRFVPGETLSMDARDRI